MIQGGCCRGFHSPVEQDKNDFRCVLVLFKEFSYGPNGNLCGHLPWGSHILRWKCWERQWISVQCSKGQFKAAGIAARQEFFFPLASLPARPVQPYESHEPAGS